MHAHPWWHVLTTLRQWAMYKMKWTLAVTMVVAGVIMIIIQVLMLSRDLKQLVQSKGGAKMDRATGMRLVEMKALTADLHIIAFGGTN
jgi:hypothetical protein